MNRVFVALIVIAAVIGIVKDALPAPIPWAEPDGTAMRAITERSLDVATSAATIALGLIGVLALWMGIMRVAEQAGLVAMLARALRPLLVRVFPDVPADHPAMGAIVMNMSANFLGLGNAATPLGLEAMKRLQELNPDPTKKTASNAMVLFLALNTTHITLIPARTIALRVANGSEDATNIMVPTILATLCGTIVAFVAARSMQRFYPMPTAAPPSSPPAPTPSTSGTNDTSEPRPADEGDTNDTKAKP